MKTADAALVQAKKDALELQASLKAIGIDDRKIASSVSGIEGLSKKMSGLRDVAVETAVAVNDVGVSPTSAARSVAGIQAETRAMKDLRDATLETVAAQQLSVLPGMTGGQAGFGGRTIYRDPASGRMVGSAIPMYGPTRTIGTSPVVNYGANYGPNLPPGGLYGERAIPMGPAATRIPFSSAVHYGSAFGPMTKEEALRSRFGLTGAIGDVRGSVENPLRQGFSGGGDIAGARRYLDDLGFTFGEGGGITGGKGSSDTGGGGNRGYNNRGFFSGFLPGGRRASAGVITTAIGLGLATGPTLAPAAAGLAVGGSAAITSALGGIGTLALALHGLSAAAFTTQKAFDALTPAQQAFVQTLRSLGAGIGATLTKVAQNTVLPGLSASLHQLFTPQFSKALTGGVASFGGSISGGAQDLGKLFGSAGFSGNFGKMLQQDAGYLRDMIDEAGNLIDAFVRLNVAAGPFIQWLSKGTLSFTEWIDDSIKAGQTTGALASYFDKARIALQTLGNLAGSIGDVFGAIFGAVGFSNSTSLINLFAKAFRELAAFINSNKTILRDFFGGALASANDLLGLIHTLSKAIAPVLNLINNLLGGVKGWESVINSVATLWVARFALMKLATIGVADATVVASTRLGILQAGLAGLAGKVFAVGVLVSLIPPSGVGQKDLDKVGLGFLGHLPVVGGAITQAQALLYPASQYIKEHSGPLSTSGPLRTAPPGVPFTSLAESAKLRKKFLAAQNPKTGSALAIQNLAAGLISDVQNLPGNYLSSPAFSTPTGLDQGTPTPFSLPNNLQLALAKASTTKKTSDDKKALRAAIAYLKKNVSGLSTVDQISAYNEESSLQGQLASLLGTSTIKRGTDLLPKGIAGRLSSAQNAATAATSTTPTRVHGLISGAEDPRFYASAYKRNAPYAIKGPYQTKLSSAQEKAFRAWVMKNHVPFDVNATEVDYDMRGYWLAMIAGKVPPWAGGNTHFPDTFKTPYDTRFSNQSKYATANNPFAFKGNNLVNTRTGQLIIGSAYSTQQIEANKKLLTVQLQAQKNLMDQHATGKQLIALDKERAAIKKQIAETDAKISREETSLAASVLRLNLSKVSTTLSGLTGNLSTRLSGASPSQQVSASIKALTGEGKQLEILRTLKAEQTTAAARAEVQKKIFAVQTDLKRAGDDLLKGLKAEKQAKFNTSVDRILGIGANAGIPSVTQIRTHERNVLQTAAKQAGIILPGSASIKAQVSQLETSHALTKAQLTSLQKINQVLEKSAKGGGILDPNAKANITARLDQIKQSLQKNTLLNNYIEPGAHKLTQGLNPADRVMEEGKLAQFFGHGKKVPGLALNGVPIGNSEAARAAGTTGRLGLSAAGSLVVHININGHNKDPKELAREISNQVQKNHRRNPTQIRGAQAGKNQGMG